MSDRAPASDRAASKGRGSLLTLLAGVALERNGGRLQLSAGTQRLLAFMALQDRPTKRAEVAGRLWPDAAETHANANLRSALWRLQRVAPKALEVDPHELRLGRDLEVDLHRAKEAARRILDPEIDPDPGPSVGATWLLTALSSELLPGWYDEWVLVEAESWRQLRLHALERLASHLIEKRRLIEALEAATEAVRADPLRESSTSVLISVHVAEGNPSEAVRAFERYRDLLRRELGLEPTPELWRLLEQGRPPTRIPEYISNAR